MIYKRILAGTTIAVLTVSQVLFSFPFSVPQVKETQAATRLGLHVTQEELNCWRQRAGIDPQGTNGITCPVMYKTLGDVSTNSPGDWDRISSNAENFRGNPTQGIWNGPTVSGCVTGAQRDPPVQTEAARVRDAAFKALLTANSDPSGSTDLKTKVRDWLVTQAAQGGVQFSDRSRWCIQAVAADVMFTISEWNSKLLHAMDYIEILDPNVFTTTQRNTLRDWFFYWGEMLNESAYLRYALLYPNRLQDDYSQTPPANAPDYYLYMEADGTFGPAAVSQPLRFWNNRAAGVSYNTAIIGAKFNIDAFKTHMARWVKEVLRFSVWPQGAMTDFFRSWEGTESNPNGDRGWSYASSILGNSLGIADVLARQGNTEVFEFSTSAGYHGTEGGNKNLLFAMTFMCQYPDHTYNRYGSRNPAHAGVSDYRIDGRYADGRQALHMLWYTIGNQFYNSNYIKNCYMKTGAGHIGYPTPAQTIDGTYHLQGPGMNFPGVLFMFGQMEDKVDPYGSSSPTPTPTPTSTSGPIAHWKLDDPSGSATVTDSAGTYTGTVNGSAAFQPAGGRIGGALSFDGVNDYVNVPNLSVTGNTGSFTAWVNFSDFADYRDLVKNTGNAGSGQFYVYGNRTTGNIVAQMAGVTATGNAAVSAGSWHHVAVTYNAGTIAIYLDGVLDRTVTGSNNSYSFSGINLGAQSSGASELLKGSMDDIRVYNRALTQTEIQTLANPSSSTPTPTPTPTPAPTACHQYTSTSAIPAGFGSPYDVLSSPTTNLMNVTCNTTSATVNLGKNDPMQYIYNTGYLFKTGGSAWTPVPFTSTESLIANAWYPKTANTTIPLTSTELSQPSYVLTYLCTWIGSGWKCGCRDSACTQSYWQIQQFKR